MAGKQSGGFRKLEQMSMRTYNRYRHCTYLCRALFGVLLGVRVLVTDFGFDDRNPSCVGSFWGPFGGFTGGSFTCNGFRFR